MGMAGIPRLTVIRKLRMGCSLDRRCAPRGTRCWTCASSGRQRWSRTAGAPLP